MIPDYQKWKEVLRELTSCLALSGYEDSVIRYVKEKLAGKAEEIGVDPLGNVIARMNSSKMKDPYRVMVFAHMDELGMIVTKIEEDGFLRVERLGGIPEKSLAGTTLLIEVDGKRWPGIVGTKSHHVTRQDEKYKVLPINETYADFGFRSKRDVLAAGISPGTPVGYARQFFDNGSIVFSNTLDNRVGCLALLELADRLQATELPCELYIVFSVQEEFNLRGVLPAIRKVNPHLAITLDITIATDTPDLKGSADIRLGGGPSMGMYTFHGRGTLGGLIPNPKLVRHVQKIAREHDIPLQQAVFMGILTDASFSQLENDGIPMIDLGYPARYTHAPVEAVDLHDVEQLICLLEKLVLTCDHRLDLSRG
ncbi:M42 family metallopeptidase [Brevibacillus choshinensis]|uniref:M20/M25/M40 family metallo-hydrolase n=1 Tax=Brevibacillus choshinensis TaxID=54911 RepID=A0ABX7FRR5_BRECH|nr:M20/M25/M40 family metallo-hydrolase [Brevibacillus choshinensis]QRG68322.1 M20/M25/M40 family metallo-hydrolase [Brevibacillus choshinensis]